MGGFPPSCAMLGVTARLGAASSSSSPGEPLAPRPVQPGGPLSPSLPSPGAAGGGRGCAPCSAVSLSPGCAAQPLHASSDVEIPCAPSSVPSSWLYFFGVSPFASTSCPLSFLLAMCMGQQGQPEPRGAQRGAGGHPRGGAGLGEPPAHTRSCRRERASLACDGEHQLHGQVGRGAARGSMGRPPRSRAADE